MHRAVTALLGPTNTGKTHLALERMLTHPTGMIGFPLRKPTYWMCTVEAMPLDLRTDFLAVDERCC